MKTYVVEMQHDRHRTITEVEAETFDEAICVAGLLQGSGIVIGVMVKSTEDGYDTEPCAQVDFAA